VILARAEVVPEAPRRRTRVAVVIPAHNEAAHVGQVIAGVPSWVDRIFVVDDASTDHTAKLVAELSAPRLTLISLPRNGGVGAAVKAGYQAALAAGADVVVKMDGDGQMDPAHLPALISPILRGAADFTKGNRFRHGPALDAMPLVRRIGNLALSFLCKVASGYWNIFDPTNGYTAIRRELLAELALDRLADGYYFEISTLVELNLHHAVVRDVPMPARYGSEESGLAIPRIMLGFPPRLLASATSRFFRKNFFYDFTATALLFLTGLPLAALGAGIGAHFWTKSIATGVPTTAGQVMLSGLPLLVGIQLLLQAFVADIAAVPSASLHPPLPSPFESDDP
jgi:glycosyltransferase involved in cell wall biosynthesis